MKNAVIAAVPFASSFFGTTAKTELSAFGSDLLFATLTGVSDVVLSAGNIVSNTIEKSSALDTEGGLSSWGSSKQAETKDATASEVRVVEGVVIKAAQDSSSPIVNVAAAASAGAAGGFQSRKQQHRHQKHPRNTPKVTPQQSGVVEDGSNDTALRQALRQAGFAPKE